VVELKSLERVPLLHFYRSKQEINKEPDTYKKPVTIPTQTDDES